MQKPMRDGVGDDPPSPLRFQSLGNDNDAVHLQLAEDFERPRLHFQPKAIGHRFSINTTLQAQFLPQRGASLLSPIHRFVVPLPRYALAAPASGRSRREAVKMAR